MNPDRQFAARTHEMGYKGNEVEAAELEAIEVMPKVLEGLHHVDVRPTNLRDLKLLYLPKLETVVVVPPEISQLLMKLLPDMMLFRHPPISVIHRR